MKAHPPTHYPPMPTPTHLRQSPSLPGCRRRQSWNTARRTVLPLPAPASHLPLPPCHPERWGKGWACTPARLQRGPPPRRRREEAPCQQTPPYLLLCFLFLPCGPRDARLVRRRAAAAGCREYTLSPPAAGPPPPPARPPHRPPAYQSAQLTAPRRSRAGAPPGRRLSRVGRAGSLPPPAFPCLALRGQGMGMQVSPRARGPASQKRFTRPLASYCYPHPRAWHVRAPSGRHTSQSAGGRGSATPPRLLPCESFFFPPQVFASPATYQQTVQRGTLYPAWLRPFQRGMATRIGTMDPLGSGEPPLRWAGTTCTSCRNPIAGTQPSPGPKNGTDGAGRSDGRSVCSVGRSSSLQVPGPGCSTTMTWPGRQLYWAPPPKLGASRKGRVTGQSAPQHYRIRTKETAGRAGPTACPLAVHACSPCCWPPQHCLKPQVSLARHLFILQPFRILQATRPALPRLPWAPITPLTIPTSPPAKPSPAGPSRQSSPYQGEWGHGGHPDAGKAAPGARPPGWFERQAAQLCHSSPSLLCCRPQMRVPLSLPLRALALLLAVAGARAAPAAAACTDVAPDSTFTCEQQKVRQQPA